MGVGGAISRNDELNIGTHFYLIETELTNLFADLHAWRQGTDYPLIEQAARLHHLAVKIHPFANGNGRWSRMLANILLRREGHPITEWPDATIGQKSVIRDEYIAAIKAADDLNYEPLLALHRRYTPEPPQITLPFGPK